MFYTFLVLGHGFDVAICSVKFAGKSEIEEWDAISIPYSIIDYTVLGQLFFGRGPIRGL